MKRSTFLMAPWVAPFIAFSAFTASFAWADPAYPSKPIRIIVPFTPGGSPDVWARTIGQKITESTGAAVVVETCPVQAARLVLTARLKQQPMATPC